MSHIIFSILLSMFSSTMSVQASTQTEDMKEKPPLHINPLPNEGGGLSATDQSANLPMSVVEILPLGKPTLMRLPGYYKVETSRDAAKIEGSS